MSKLSEYNDNNFGVYIDTVPHLVLNKSTNGHPSLVLLSLVNDFVMFYGTSDVDSHKCSIILYNTLHQMAHSRRNLKKPNSKHPTRIWKIHDFIVMKLNLNLYIVRYNVVAQCHSELVGVKMNTDKLKTSKICNEDDHIEYYFAEREMCDYPNDNDCDNGEDDMESENITYYLQPNKRKSKKGNKKDITFADGFSVPFTCANRLQKLFKEMTQLNIHVSLTSENRYENITMETYPYINAEMFDNTQIEKLANRMEKSGKSDDEICITLSKILMKNYLIDDLHKCIKRYPLTSEKALSKMLAFLCQQTMKLNHYSKKKEKIITNTVMSTRSKTRILKGCKNLHEKLHSILGSLILCNFDVKKMALSMEKNLNFENILFLIRFLHFCAMEPLKFTGIRNKPAQWFNDNYYLLDIHLLKWLSVIFNAKLTNFLTHWDLSVIRMLFQINCVIDTIESCWEDLSDVSSEIRTLLHLNDKSLKNSDVNDQTMEIFQGNNCSNNYSIQTITLY